ncbi:hypothetical protein [Alkaliphilus peptidifermentans]|uniref:Uncharacterized protein n=1 Tax=Alkaliphilus peptidifermentans DSM 18978 TaxID=1120976 RepID=A0A1G5BBZ1_9FIRM|nr:hypothetical protein [Alkaliphilus peptidifermentans]SCX87665.1 hypothetical protein SAMN03080606_00365 [Alkaliphilus peptidifermentans DSM 18978]
MKYFYSYKKNDYAALLAAYLHLEMDYNQITEKKLKPYKLYYMGSDRKLDEVYLIKYPSSKKETLMNILNGMGYIFNENSIINDLSKYDGLFYRLYKNNIKKDIEMRVVEWRHENNL